MSYPTQSTYNQPPRLDTQRHYPYRPIHKFVQPESSRRSLFPPAPIRYVDINRNSIENFAPLIRNDGQQPTLVFGKAVAEIQHASLFRTGNAKRLERFHFLFNRGQDVGWRVEFVKTSILFLRGKKIGGCCLL